MSKIFVSVSLLLYTVSGFLFPNHIHRSRYTLSAFNSRRSYHISPLFHEQYIRRLNSKNVTQQTNAILGKRYGRYIHSDDDDEIDDEEESECGFDESIWKNSYDDDAFDELFGKSGGINISDITDITGLRIIIDNTNVEDLDIGFGFAPKLEKNNRNTDSSHRNRFRSGSRKSAPKKSDNFEVIETSDYSFTDIGGYDNIKRELDQCIDILSNYTKYENYNVRIPKGLIFEGPPGNGKTLFAKALAGEAKIGFIAVSGAEFMEKYVGTGGMKVRELFKLANDNKPCIVFIDEIDAIGKKRSSDGETSTSERDSTLNELLIALDGFKNSSGVFLVGATNRIDLLDPALIRPGRIDKRIFINNPDDTTRKAILNIHLNGKPHDESVVVDSLVEQTEGLSGAQLENLLNEAMLNALRYNRHTFNMSDIDTVMNKIMVGWQPNEHKFTSDIIDHIAIHELGHAVVGLLCKHHPNVIKVIINLSAPTSPGYTVFENTPSSISTREALFEHLMILLSGRIAEEVFYGVSVTTGAINDFEEALKLAQKMIVFYGMGKSVIYPSMSEKYKEIIDVEVTRLIHDAYSYAEFLVRNSKDLIYDGSIILKENNVLSAATLIELMNVKYKTLLNLQNTYK
jgi:cell division protease FtsH